MYIKELLTASFCRMQQWWELLYGDGGKVRQKVVCHGCCPAPLNTAHTCAHTPVCPKRREAGSSAAGADLSSQPLRWGRTTWTCDLCGLSSPQQVCCRPAWDRAAGTQGMPAVLARPCYSSSTLYTEVIYSQEKIDSITQC